MRPIAYGQAASVDLGEGLEDLLVLRFVVYAVAAIHVPKHAVAVDDEEGATTASATIVDHIVCARDAQLLVAQVGESQATQHIGKRAVRLERVVADSQNFGIKRLELVVVRPQGG